MYINFVFHFVLFYLGAHPISFCYCVSTAMHCRKFYRKKKKKNIIRKGRDDESDGRKEREKGRNQEYTEGKKETK